MKQPSSIQQALIVYKKWEYPKSPFRFEHQKTLKTVLAVLKKYHIPHKQISRRNLKKLDPYDLIITVGGDGTFLHASHFANRHHLLLGVNSAPGVSVGAYCATHRKSFEKIIFKLLTNRIRPRLLQRLQITIHSNKIPILSLNDILFANPIPAGTARYSIKIGKKIEEHKSSGVWISTASGSTAAIRSAGGRTIERTSSKFQFVVRELFMQKGIKPKLKKGTLLPSQKIILTSKMPKASLFIDGAHVCYPLRYGESAKIEVIQNPIRAIL